jgi:ubiquitin-protein ligase
MRDTNGKIKHHYHTYSNNTYVANPNKMIRLAQELADLSNSLPIEHTNSIFVRCDKERIDYMQALIMGSNDTPYGHGAYLFDIYF